MTDGATKTDAAPAVSAPRPREIKPLDPKKFGKGAELKEKLKAILKDVPVLHERLTQVTGEMERLSREFREATEKAQKIVAEWEALNEQEKAQARE